MAVWQGLLWSVGTFAYAEPVDAGGGGGDLVRYMGWSYGTNSGQNENGTGGNGNDWQFVLSRWKGSGTCTLGWEVWFDGQRVCDGTSGIGMS